MLQEQDIRRLAIDEVVNPSFEVTKQYLRWNKLVFEAGKPVIDDVIIEEGGTGAQVFFPVLGEQYYFVVHADIGQEISVRWCGMSAGNTVELLVVSDSIPLSVLMEQLDIVPTCRWEKGERRSAVGVVQKDNRFIYSLTNKRTGNVEDKLKALTSFLMPRRERMIQLAESTTMEISIAYYGYSSEMWGIHLDAETLSTVTHLGLSIDIDLYASGTGLGE